MRDSVMQETLLVEFGRNINDEFIESDKLEVMSGSEEIKGKPNIFSKTPNSKRSRLPSKRGNSDGTYEQLKA